MRVTCHGTDFANVHSNDSYIFSFPSVLLSFLQFICSFFHWEGCLAEVRLLGARLGVDVALVARSRACLTLLYVATDSSKLSDLKVFS